MTWFGAYEIDPKYMSFYICVETDRTKDQLEGDVDLMQNLRAVLQQANYPPEAQDQVFISFASQETVNRDFQGNWYYYFK
jgi:hypothetical protein